MVGLPSPPLAVCGQTRRPEVSRACCRLRVWGLRSGRVMSGGRVTAYRAHAGRVPRWAEKCRLLRSSGVSIQVLSAVWSNTPSRSVSSGGLRMRKFGGLTENASRDDTVEHAGATVIVTITPTEADLGRQRTILQDHRLVTDTRRTGRDLS